METYIKIHQVNLNNLPVKLARSTIYKWQKEGRYPEMFKKIGGSILVDIEKLIKLLEKGDDNE